MSKINIVFSASSLDLFQLCKARFNYGHNMRMRKEIQEIRNSKEVSNE